MSRGDAGDFAPTVCEFWQPNRIPYSPLRPRTQFMRWFSSDSEENYHRQGNKAFTVESVSYEFNSLGYRGSEFDRRPGEAAVIFLGDSNTVGVGMPWERLWTTLVNARLEERWDKPVRQCNLGFGATGSDYTAMMVHQAVDVIRPEAVFVLWSFLSRITWFPNPRVQVHFHERQHAVHAQEHAAFLQLATDAQGFFNFVRNFTLVRERLLRQGIPLYWGTMTRFPPGTLEAYLPCEGYVGALETLDLARDGKHPGVRSHAAFAERLMASMDRDAANCPTPKTSSSSAYGAGILPSLARPADSVASNGGSTSSAQRPTGHLTSPVRSLLQSIRTKHRIWAHRRGDPFIY